VKNNAKRHPLIIALVLVLIASIALSATAANLAGDVNGDGKVTVFDAQLLLEAQAGLRELTAEQQANAGNSTLQDILDFVLGIREPSAYDVQVGQTFKSSELAEAGVNGANGMTFYHTANGTDLTPFAGYDPNNHNGRWYYMTDAEGMVAFVDPFVNPADNYGWIGTSIYASVTIGYKMPEAGTITLTNWLALHTGNNVRILIAQGTPSNVVGGFDLTGEADAAFYRENVLKVEKNEMVYVTYQPLETTLTADTCYYGYQSTFTYTAVGPETEEEITVNRGDVFKFTELAGKANGDNGLTWYYTADGQSLTPYSLFDASEGRWYEVTNNAVTFFDPQEVMADNYGLAQTSASNYVVAGYEVPATGTINLFTWTVTQAGTGHEVIVSLGSLNNVVDSYVTTQGTVAHSNYSLNVTKGQTIYLTYKPIEPADGEWLGYQTSVTYTKVPVEVQEGSGFEGATLAPIEMNGDNGVTLYYSDGTYLTPYATRDPNTNGGRWYHNPYEDVIASFVDPAAIVADNYGLVGSSAEEYVVIGYEMPAAGQIQLDTWIALHTASPYRILISKGELSAVVAGRDVAGVVDTISYEHDLINVDAGEMVYVSYIPLAEGATSGACYAGFKTGYTYKSVGIIDEETPVAVGTSFKSTELAGENNGDNGFTMYYTADGVALTAYELYDAAQGRWYEVTNDTVSFFDPQENPTDNYGMLGNNATNYCVAAYQMPATGTIDLFTWTANQNGAGYQVSVAVGSLNNVVFTYDATELGVPMYCSEMVDVIAGQTVYIIYKPMAASAGDWCGYINQYTYSSVG